MADYKTTLRAVLKPRQLEPNAFKAKDLSGYWIHGSWIHKASDVCLDPANDKDYIESFDMMDWGLTTRKKAEVDGSTVCRYTWVNDSKDALVYEKDLVSVEGFAAVQVVVWSPETAQYLIMAKADGYLICTETLSELVASNKQFKVVGNLYDNLEQLGTLGQTQ